jgi:hypothetical protein
VFVGEAGEEGYCVPLLNVSNKKFSLTYQKKKKNLFMFLIDPNLS